MNALETRGLGRGKHGAKQGGRGEDLGEMVDFRYPKGLKLEERIKLLTHDER